MSNEMMAVLSVSVVQARWVQEETDGRSLSSAHIKQDVLA